jgi:hypothetical protein
MNFASKLALAATLSLGTTMLTVAPATAQEKGPQIKVSPEFRKAATPAEAAVNAQNWTAAEPLIAQTETIAKNDDERYYSAWLRMRMELGRGNEMGQAAPLQSLIANPKTPKDVIPAYQARLAFLQGKAAMSAKKYPDVITYMTKARELGEKNLDISLMMANAYAAMGKNAEAAAETRISIDYTKASGQKAPESWYQFAIPKVAATGDRNASADWLALYLRDYPSAKNWRWAIEVFGQGAKGTDRAAKVEQIDLYRLRRVTNSLADRADYGDYAYAAQSTGLPWEAISVIEEGRNSGKLTTSDADTSRTYTAAQAGVKSSPSLDALAKQGAAGDGKTAALNGDALLAAGDNARALALYDQALSKGGADTNQVNLHRGIALQRLGRKDEARAAYQAVKSGSLANVALLWQASVDTPPAS